MTLEIVATHDGHLARTDHDGATIRVRCYPDVERHTRARRLIDEQYQAAVGRLRERCLEWAITAYAPAIPVQPEHGLTLLPGGVTS